MANLRRRWLGALTVAGLVGAAGAAPRAADAEAGPDDAVAAYRRGDYESASALWERELEATGDPAEKARLAYDLGNASYRSGHLLEAIGWYTAALRHEPRDADTWANLELARAEAGLEPADRGDLAATTLRVLSSLTLAESEWLVLGSLALLALALSWEALHGGRAARRAALAAAGLTAIALVPWCWNLLDDSTRPALIVAEDGTPARSEPRPDGTRLFELEPGTRVERLDVLPGWVEVAADGRAVWVAEGALFDLVR